MHRSPQAGDVITSPESGRSYRVGATLGEGGFGKAFQAAALNRRRGLKGLLCLKVSTSQEGWMREAYFARLYGGDSRALKIHEAFPFCRRDGVLYCLVLEWAPLGDLSAYLVAAGRGFTE